MQGRREKETVPGGGTGGGGGGGPENIKSENIKVLHVNNIWDLIYLLNKT